MRKDWPSRSQKMMDALLVSERMCMRICTKLLGLLSTIDGSCITSSLLLTLPDDVSTVAADNVWCWSLTDTIDPLKLDVSWLAAKRRSNPLLLAAGSVDAADDDDALWSVDVIFALCCVGATAAPRHGCEPNWLMMKVRNNTDWLSSLSARIGHHIMFCGKNKVRGAVEV